MPGISSTSLSSAWRFSGVGLKKSGMIPPPVVRGQRVRGALLPARIELDGAEQTIRTVVVLQRHHLQLDESCLDGREAKLVQRLLHVSIVRNRDLCRLHERTV